MKQFITFIFVSLTLLGHSQITILPADMPVPDKPYTLVLSNAPALNPDFIDKTWNYTNVTPVEQFTVQFYKEEIPDFVAAGIDVYRTVSKSFNSDFIFYTDQEIDFNDTAVQDKGMYVAEQKYPLQPITGNNKDSLVIPEQAYLYSDATDIVRFPFSKDSTWTSVARRFIDFNLTVTAYGLNKMPARHVWYTFRKDTIVGYGKMSILTPDGPSKSYDVLVDQVTLFSRDSFYLAGQPAPAALLNAFQVSQGQTTNIGNRINFYRKGSFFYLGSFFYGTLAFDKQPEEFYFNITDAEIATNTEENVSGKILMYPTLLNAGESLNVAFDKMATGGIITAYDMSGQLIISRKFEPGQSLLSLNIPENTTGGQYVLVVQNVSNDILFKEFFQVH